MSAPPTHADHRGLLDTRVEVCTGALVDGRYDVKRAIARGGMGLVHEAQHVVLGSVVALKTLTANGLASEALRARVVREGQFLARLSHPGIVRALDAGECATYGPYLALERIAGRSVDGLLAARRRLDPVDVAQLALQLGEAISFAHDHGIVHRDIKPSNVMVARGDAGEVVRLIDFGVATTLGETVAKLTRAGSILGTVEYMAPEMLLEGEPASIASDVYALGVTLYECLVGDVPFRGSARSIVCALAADEAVPPIRDVRTDVPVALDAAITRALAHTPADRWPSARAFGQACAPHVSLARPALGLLTPTTDQSEGRQFARAPYVSPVRMIIAGGVVDGRAEDVSEGGLLVVTDTLVGENQDVFVRWPLPISGHVITCHARGRWTRTRRGQKAIGLAFQDLAEDARADIRRYVEMMGVETPKRVAPRVAA